MDEALDLFAGPGGWSVACQSLGVEDHGIEIDGAACATREAAGHATVARDVLTTDLSDFTHYVGHIGSPPCPTFSQAGSGSGRAEFDIIIRAIADMRNRQTILADCQDARTRLVVEPLRYALALRPEWLAWEQVPTVLPVWEACASVLRTVGYSVWTGNLTAEMYGVPQTRKRAVLLASLRHEQTPPRQSHSRYYPRDPARLDAGYPSWISMAEALGWGLGQRPSYTITAGGAETGGAEIFARGARAGMSICMTNVRENSAVRTADQPAPTVAFGHELPRWIFNRPSTTIVGSFRPEVVAAPGYRVAGSPSRQNTPDSVKVTVSEAGVLQSFPQGYPWQGSKTKQFQQVGNAIPVLLAQACLNSVIGNVG